MLQRGDLVDSGPAEGSEAADAPAVEAQAVGAGDVLPLAFELEQCCLAEAVAAADGEAVVARALEFCEELADLGGSLLGGSEVEGVLASMLAIDEAVVGSEAAVATGAVGGDHGADAGEDRGVSADEVEGRLGHGLDGRVAEYVHVYQCTELQSYVNRRIGQLWSLFQGQEFQEASSSVKKHPTRGTQKQETPPVL